MSTFQGKPKTGPTKKCIKQTCAQLAPSLFLSFSFPEVFFSGRGFHHDNHAKHTVLAFPPKPHQGAPKQQGRRKIPQAPSNHPPSNFIAAETL